jgi:hypothetical protein
MSEQHIIISVNWSPQLFKGVCTSAEKQSKIQRDCCPESRRCYKEKWEKGCMSAVLFRDHKYYTSRKAIKKGRLAFFIAKNPFIENEFYLVGFFTIKTAEPEQKYKRRGRTYYIFEGIREQSVRLPYYGPNLTKFDADLVRELPSLKVDWKNRHIYKSDASYISVCMRNNPRYISSGDAIHLLQVAFDNSEDEKIEKLLKQKMGELLEPII